MQNDAEGMLPINPLTQIHTHHTPTIEEAEEYLKGNGYPLDSVPAWHSNRERQGWVTGAGLRITNWQADLKSWVYGDARKAKTNGSRPLEKRKYENEF
jgi:hypothetical protein